MPDRRPRVLVFNHFAAPRGEAGGTRHVELFSRLQGWDHLIIASDLNPLTQERVGSEPGFSVVRVPAYSSNGARRVLNWLVYALRAFWLGLRQRDVAVVYGSSPHLLAALAAWGVAALKRRPFVMEVRDLWPQVLVDMGQLSESSLLFRALRRLETFLYARAKAVIVMAEGSVDALAALGVPRELIHYIPNAADPEDFEPTASREALRARYGFERFTAIYTGAHGPANGLDLLLDAAAEVADLPIDIIMVGGGVLKDSLVARARTEGLSNVRFLDPVPKEEIPDLLAAADLGLHVLADVELFRTAVSPNKVFDYMAAGLPVLTNSPGVVGDLVGRAGCGLAAQPREMASALGELVVHHGTVVIDSLGSSGRGWIATYQSRTTMARQLGSVLESVGRGPSSV